MNRARPPGPDLLRCVEAGERRREVVTVGKRRQVRYPAGLRSSATWPGSTTASIQEKKEQGRGGGVRARATRTNQEAENT